nr:basic helix-loop-helix transcription factor [Loropetalum chinense var. rubrum]
MDHANIRSNASANDPSLYFTNDFGLHDFINDANFDQFIDLIRGESGDHDHVNSFNPVDYNNCQPINGCSFVDHAQFGPTPGELFDFNSTVVPEPINSFINSLPNIDVEMKGGEEEDDGEDSYATTTTAATTPTKRTKVDRSRTLVSERRRRGRMKEKLYALRSLVPNITKMDKASIVGDAILYVQELKMQAKKLGTEIATLELSIKQGEERHQGSVLGKQKRIQLTRSNLPICRKIMDMFQVEEKGFYVRLVCSKGEGVAVSLYKALESLMGFDVQSSNLATLSDTFILTFNLNVILPFILINHLFYFLWGFCMLIDQ